MAVTKKQSFDTWFGTAAEKAAFASMALGDKYFATDTGLLYTYSGAAWVADPEDVLVLGAGTALVGKFGIDQTTPGTTNKVVAELTGSKTGDKITATVTRPDAAEAYGIGDVVGNTTYLTFANVGVAGQEVEVLDCNFLFKKEATNLAFPEGMTTFKLYLYTEAPTAIADNAAWALPYADANNYAKVCLQLSMPVDRGDVLVSENSGLNRLIKLVSTDLFGYLVTDTAYTPVALVVNDIDLHIVAV